MRILQVLLAAALGAIAAAAHAGMGLATLHGLGCDGPVTVFYPTAQAERPVQRAAFTLSVAEDAPPLRGNGRLVVISHGSGGIPWVHADLARTLVEAGFTVAAPLHHADNALDPGNPGPDSWKLRPGEVSRAIDAVAQSPRFAKLLAFDRVGVWGISAGGHTALTLAGGRWSPQRFVQHCEAHIRDDFAFCVGLLTAQRGNALDTVKQKAALAVIRWRFDDPAWYTHQDPRVQAVVATVPAAADFDPASLATPRVPLALITAGQDRWLAPALHAQVILQACEPRCTHLADLPAGGHGAFLSPPPPAGRLGAIAADLLGDPPGFDRAQVPAVDRAIATFFTRHLVP